MKSRTSYYRPGAPVPATDATINPIKMNPSSSLLYQISGKELKVPSYVFGTFHALCRSDFELKPKVLKALESCAGLYLEVNLTDPVQTDAMAGMMYSSTKMSDHLNPDQQLEMDHLLKKYDLSLEAAEHFTIPALYSMFALQAIPCPKEEMVMLEAELMHRAEALGLPVYGLETAADQRGFLDEVYSWTDCIAFLQKGEAYQSVCAEMIAAYKQEDLVALDFLVRDKRFLTKKAADIFLTRRNTNWVQQMELSLPTGPGFYAVGAGHLWGENGLLNLLGSQGYNVTPLFDETCGTAP